MGKLKNRFKRIVSMMIAVVLLVTSITFSGFSLESVNAATAYYPTLNFNLGKLSSPNSHVGKLTYDGKQAEMCNITISGEPVFCMLLNGSLSRHNAFYTADIDAYGKSYQKYFRGCIYYYEDINDEFSLNKTQRYVVSQIMLWRILQIRHNDKSGTYNNIMTDFESTFKDVIDYWGECNADKAWKEIKQVMQWVNNDYDKVDSKHVKLYLWTHKDGTQPLLRGDVEPYDERAYIAVQKSGTVDNANVNNAEFGIYSKKACDDDSLICKITTDKDGYAVTSNTKAKKLKAGTTYHIKETKAPAGSKINSDVYSVKTAEGNNSKKKAVKINVTDEQQRVKIGITKVDKDNNSKKLSGATFRVYQWNATSKTYETYKDYATGGNGKFTTDWLYYTKINTGKFRIEEISAPANYKKATFKRDIQIGNNNTDTTLEYTVENEKYPGWIEIHKAAFLDNKDVSDKVNLTATFSIYSDAACTKNVGSITTNSSGFGKSGDLKEGTYYVKETRWTGRLKPSFKEAQEIRVNSNSTTNVYGKPGELAGQTPDCIGIKLIKTDETNKSLALEGAVFEIREWNGSSWSLKYTLKTNEAGVIEIPVEDNKLYYTEKNQGRFQIVEITAPLGYEKDDEPKDITIDDSNTGTTVDLGIITNKPKGGSLEIQKIITDAAGNKITDIPVNDGFLQISYGLYTDAELKNPVNDSISLDENGHARIENLSAGIYYLAETTYNKNIFATPGESTKRYIEVTIKRNNTTYVDGEKGYSEDGKQWFDCWNNVSTINRSAFYNVNDLPDFNFANRSLLNNPFNTYRTIETFGINEYQVIQDTNAEKKTIKDVKNNWKDLSDNELDEILGNTDDKDLSEFITDLSDGDLKLILSKDTRLVKPYITYKPIKDDGQLVKDSEEIFWQYLVNLSREPETTSTLSRTSGYFYITITGDGKTTNIKVSVSASRKNTDDKSVTMTYSISGNNNHGFVLRSTSKPTTIADGGNYNRMFCDFSYTKPAHYVSSGTYSGNYSDYYISWYGDNTHTMNNTGHNTVNVTEWLTAGLHVTNAGLFDRDNKTYHATMTVNLSKQYGGVRVNPNGGTWTYGSNKWTTDTGAYWAYVCGSNMWIPNPVRTGYTFKGWSVSNGANAHGSLSGNTYGSTITSGNSILTCGGKASSTAQAITNGYYTTLTANWQVNSYNVTCIDVVGTNQYGKELGRSNYRANYGTTTSGAAMGSNSDLDAYHKGYYYTGSSYATVTENGATVYRFFSKSPAEVQAPNVLKNVLKTIELDIIKTDSKNEAKTLDATFNVLEWSKELSTYVPYLTGIKAQQRVTLRLTFDNLGKYKVAETDVESGYTMSGATAEVSIYDENAFEIPFYENVLGVDDDKGVFVNGRGYNAGDIVRNKVDKDNATYYKCLIANIGKNVTDTTYWQKIELGNYVRYTDLVNGSGRWDEDYKVRTVMAVKVTNAIKDPSGDTNLSINKENASGNILTGAEFAAYYTDDNSLCEKFEYKNESSQYKTGFINISDAQAHSTYDEQTKIRTLNLVIKEEVAPVGYKKAGDIKVTIKSKVNTDTNKWEAVSKIATFEDGRTVDITSGVALTVVDEEIRLNIVLTKKAAKGNFPVNTLKGAVYGIYDNAECTSLTDSITINNEAKGYASGLILKDYWIKEISAPTSGLYKLSDEVKHIKVSDVYDNTKDVSEVNASVTVTDEPILGEILISKLGYTDMTFTKANPLKNAGFTLYEMPDIPNGINEDEYIQSYDFSNVKAVKTEVKTDINGIARFNDLPIGDYVIVETTVPDGFVKVENRVVNLTKEYVGNNDDTAYKVSLYNRPYNAQIKIRKVDSLSNKPLENAVFKIFDVAANGYIAEKIYESDEDGNEIEKLETKLYTTDEDGFITTESLKAGTYRIEEVLAPDGYIKNANHAEVVIKGGNETGVNEKGYPYFEVTVKNTPTDTCFKKVDITTKEEIKGGHYTVSDAFGNIVDEWDGTGEAHHIYGLSFNEEYTFTEETAPDGYVVAESITFTINNDGTPTEIVMEDDYNKLEISKQDITTGDELPGARLQILDEDGKVVHEWTSTSKPHRIDRIPAGTYVLKETKAPDGYIISEEIEFIVGESSEVQKVVMYDDYTKTAFIKLAEDTQDYLEGCVLQVIDKNGKVVDEWTTTKEAHYTYRLNKGDTYTLHEVSAPDEYELAKDIKFVAGEKYISEDDKALIGGGITDKDGVGIDDDSEIPDEKDEKVPVEDLTGDGNGDDEDITYADSDLTDIEGESDNDTYLPSEVVTITMTDSPLSIYPEKIDENGNPVYGAKLQILDEDNNVVYEWETDVMQTPGFKVKPGTYTLHEVEAPAGYLKFKDTKVTVTDKDVSIKLVDNTMGATVTKVDENGNLIEGASLQVLDKNKKVVDEWTSTKDVHVITTLNDGETYTLHEVSSPLGYTVASDITFTMDKANVKVEMVDRQTDLTIKKVNPFGMGLNGAKLQILDENQNVVKEFTSENNGTNIKGLPKGDYILRETSAPDGYVKSPDVQFTIGDKDLTVTMVDEFKSVKLPLTGGTPLNLLIIAMPFMLLGIAIFLISNKRKCKVTK